ncbi:MAG: response regulator [Sedimentisphaerales bacterium]|nr:response regulator [Sedimentisphaerales bacterium]
MAYTIMVVDDSATMRKIIMKTIRQADLPISEDMEEAGNGQEALVKLQQSPVDIILCDINMPEMNGLEFLEQARANPEWNHMKIVLVSTESSDDIIKNAIANGADEYVTKPFTPKIIAGKLAGLLSQ